MVKKHGISATSKGEIFYCPECSKAYAKEECLREHRQAEHFNLHYYCPFCDEKIKHDLLTHINKKHQEEKSNFEEMLKKGVDDMKYMEVNNIPVESLDKEKIDSIINYLFYSGVVYEWIMPYMEKNNYITCA